MSEYDLSPEQSVKLQRFQEEVDKIKKIEEVIQIITSLFKKMSAIHKKHQNSLCQKWSITTDFGIKPLPEDEINELSLHQEAQLYGIRASLFKTGLQIAKDFLVGLYEQSLIREELYAKLEENVSLE